SPNDPQTIPKRPQTTQKNDHKKGRTGTPKNTVPVRSQNDRQRTANELVESLGATLIPPYNHAHVITGQGTLGLELFEQAPHLDTVLIPVGGGGLCSGVAIAMKHLNPSIKIYGVEPSGADDAFQSLNAGYFIPQTNPQTIADGLRTSLGDLTYPILRDHLEGILTVSEAGIVHAMQMIWTRMKTLVEPSAAVTLAAVLEHESALDKSKHIGLVLTGGNVDLTRLPW
ncbi:MAG: pyridoxal-phosphate dependent enzyme, partial [Bradymonadia bacterium]